MSEDLKIYGPFRQLVTMQGLPYRGPIKDHQLRILRDAGVLIQGEAIRAISSFATLRSEHPSATIHQFDQPVIGLPGLIDSHTHICFAGSRAADYALRNAGTSYLEIARQGGGIWDTVQKTRAASEKDLSQATISRAQALMQRGITTVEVKSGYGLSVDQELKMLRAIRLARQHVPVDIVSTCLAAHLKPRDFEGTSENYLNFILSDLLPVVKAERLASRIDAFVEESAFSAREIKSYFQRARDMGFDITVHADQFTTGGSQVAVDLATVSADHLEASTEKEIELLAKSDVIATALPGASLGLGVSFTPARRILDAGGRLAIASDWNPGSAPMGDLLTQASVLGAFEKLSNAEVLAGVTYRAAQALSMENHSGSLEKGKLADIAVFATDDYREITYHQGQLCPVEVIKKGKLVNK